MRLGLKMENVEWKLFMDDGDKYNSLVQKSINHPEKFTNEIIYNIASMSIEKFFMAYFLKNNKMPPNHTIRDLVDYMNELSDCPVDLEEKLRYMDSFQEICSIEAYDRKTPSNNDTLKFLETCNLVASYIREKVC
ncbi:MAG: hypothetical protein PF637_10970 [Spirochaetes bacterium]|jgi:hypothetical protein|nr:hypothetical protein [Spirochaetota bacterium]